MKYEVSRMDVAAVAQVFTCYELARTHARQVAIANNCDVRMTTIMPAGNAAPPPPRDGEDWF